MNGVIGIGGTTQSLRCSLRIAIISANHYRSVELINVVPFNSNHNIFTVKAMKKTFRTIQ